MVLACLRPEATVIEINQGGLDGNHIGVYLRLYEDIAATLDLRYRCYLSVARVLERSTLEGDWPETDACDVDSRSYHKSQSWRPPTRSVAVSVAMWCY